jgi:hypothetical protein
LSNSKIEVIDRRGGRKEEPSAAPVVIEAPEPVGDRSSWKSVAYMICLVPSNAGPLVAGRAVGLRSDQKCFLADYFLSQIYPENFDWTVEARKRLETFIGCECTGGVPCAIHREYVPQWIKADTQRLELIGSSPVPEAIEVMIKAQRQSILIPR